MPEENPDLFKRPQSLLAAPRSLMGTSDSPQAPEAPISRPGAAVTPSPIADPDKPWFDGWNTIADVGRGVVAGIEEFAEDTWDLLTPEKWASDRKNHWFGIKLDTKMGELTAGLVDGIIGMIPINRGLKIVGGLSKLGAVAKGAQYLQPLAGAKLGQKLVSGAVKGGIFDGLYRSGQEDRFLSQTLQGLGVNISPVNWLAGKEDDNEFLNRVKGGIDGAFSSLGGDLALSTLGWLKKSAFSTIKGAALKTKAALGGLDSFEVGNDELLKGLEAAKKAIADAPEPADIPSSLFKTNKPSPEPAPIGPPSDKAVEETAAYLEENAAKIVQAAEYQTKGKIDLDPEDAAAAREVADAMGINPDALPDIKARIEATKKALEDNPAAKLNFNPAKATEESLAEVGVHRKGLNWKSFVGPRDQLAGLRVLENEAFKHVDAAFEHLNPQERTDLVTDVLTSFNEMFGGTPEGKYDLLQAIGQLKEGTGAVAQHASRLMAAKMMAAKISKDLADELTGKDLGTLNDVELRELAETVSKATSFFGVIREGVSAQGRALKLNDLIKVGVPSYSTLNVEGIKKLTTILSTTHDAVSRSATLTVDSRTAIREAMEKAGATITDLGGGEFRFTMPVDSKDIDPQKFAEGFMQVLNHLGEDQKARDFLLRDLASLGIDIKATRSTLKQGILTFVNQGMPDGRVREQSVRLSDAIDFAFKYERSSIRKTLKEQLEKVRDIADAYGDDPVAFTNIFMSEIKNRGPLGRLFDAGVALKLNSLLSAPTTWGRILLNNVGTTSLDWLSSWVGPIGLAVAGRGKEAKQALAYQLGKTFGMWGTISQAVADEEKISKVLLTSILKPTGNAMWQTIKDPSPNRGLFADTLGSRNFAEGFAKRRAQVVAEAIYRAYADEQGNGVTNLLRRVMELPTVAVEKANQALSYVSGNAVMALDEGTKQLVDRTEMLGYLTAHFYSKGLGMKEATQSARDAYAKYLRGVQSVSEETLYKQGLAKAMENVDERALLMDPLAREKYAQQWSKARMGEDRASIIHAQLYASSAAEIASATQEPLPIIKSMGVLLQRHPLARVMVIPFLTGPANALTTAVDLALSPSALIVKAARATSEWVHSKLLGNASAQFWKQMGGEQRSRIGRFMDGYWRTLKELDSSDPIQNSKAIGRIMLASAAYYGVYNYAKNAYDQNHEGMVITGSGPTDKNAKKLLERSGWIPFGIGKKDAEGNFQLTSYRDMEPYATILAVVSDLTAYNVLNEDQVVNEGAAAVVVHTLSTNLVDRSFFKGLGDFLEAFNRGGNPEAAKNLATQQLASVFPASALLGAMDRTNLASDQDTAEQTSLNFDDARDVLNALLSKIPGFGTAEHPGVGGKVFKIPRRNVLGETIPENKVLGEDALGTWVRLLMPVRVSGESDPLLSEAVRHGASWGIPRDSRTARGSNIKLDLMDPQYADEGGRPAYDRYMELIGQVELPDRFNRPTGLRAALENERGSLEYESLPDEPAPGMKSGKLERLNRVRDRYLRKAWEQLLSEREPLKRAYNGN